MGGVGNHSSSMGSFCSNILIYVSYKSDINRQMRSAPEAACVYCILWLGWSGKSAIFSWPYAAPHTVLNMWFIVWHPSRYIVALPQSMIVHWYVPSFCLRATILPKCRSLWWIPHSCSIWSRPEVIYASIDARCVAASESSIVFHSTMTSSNVSGKYSYIRRYTGSFIFSI